MARQTTTTSRAGGTTTTTSKTGVSSASLKVMRDLFAKAKEMFDPEGAFMGGIEAQLARTEKRAVASGMQGLAAAGLAGTSMAGGLGKKFQEEVAMPQLAQAESTRLSALAGLYQSQAGAEAQMAPRYTTQTTTTPYTSTMQQTTLPRAPSRTAPSPMPTFQTQQPSTPSPRKAPPAPTVRRRANLPDPVGTRQATIGGISYYSDGQGGFTTQGQSTTQRQPTQLSSLSSFYTPELKKSLAAAFTAL